MGVKYHKWLMFDLKWVDMVAEAFLKSFLRKFVAALYLRGIEDIPFAGDEFQNGVEFMRNELINSLNEEQYSYLSDLFVKTPVLEMYSQIRDLLMSLNGDTISFVGVDNPYWTRATIKMNEYYANKIMRDKRVCDIDESIVRSAMEQFCKGAGIEVWEQF